MKKYILTFFLVIILVLPVFVSAQTFPVVDSRYQTALSFDGFFSFFGTISNIVRTAIGLPTTPKQVTNTATTTGVRMQKNSIADTTSTDEGNVGQTLSIPPLKLSCPDGKTLLTRKFVVLDNEGNADETVSLPPANPQYVVFNFSECKRNGNSCNYSYKTEDGGGGKGFIYSDPSKEDVMDSLLNELTGELPCGYINSEQKVTAQFPQGKCSSNEVELDTKSPPICTTLAGKYVSASSQEDADKQAREAAEAECSGWVPECAPIPPCSNVSSNPPANQFYAYSINQSGTFYKEETVPYGSSCQSETRVCKLTSKPYKSPTVALSGSYSYFQCKVLPPPTPTPSPTPNVTPSPTPSPRPSVSPTPSITPTPTPTKTPTPVPTPLPTPIATVTPKPSTQPSAFDYSNSKTANIWDAIFKFLTGL